MKGAARLFQIICIFALCTLVMFSILGYYACDTIKSIGKSETVQCKQINPYVIDCPGYGRIAK